MSQRRISFIISANLENWSKNLAKAEKQMNRFAGNVTRIGNSLSTRITVPLLGIGTVATKVFADFEQAMAKVNAISGATSSEFMALEANAKRLGETTQFTASQVAGLQLNLSKLGFNPTQINASTEAILDLALATGEDLGMSATVAASTLKGFGMTAIDMNKVVDIMADSFSSTALDLNKFQVAMATVAPVAKKAGASLEETTAILGALVNRGVDASSSGAALRNIYLDLAEKGISWNEALNKITESTNPLATALELFGKRGATVATIIANNRDEIRGLTVDFTDSAGEAKGMADIMGNTLIGSLNRMRSAFEGAAMKVAKVFTPTLKNIIDQISNLVSSLSEENLARVTKLAIKIALIPPVILAIGAALKGVAIVLGGLSLALSPVAAMIVTFIGLLATFVIAWQTVIENFYSFKNLFHQIWDGLTLVAANFFKVMIDMIGRFLGRLNTHPFISGMFDDSIKGLANLSVGFENTARTAKLQMQALEFQLKGPGAAIERIGKAWGVAKEELMAYLGLTGLGEGLGGTSTDGSTTTSTRSFSGGLGARRLERFVPDIDLNDSKYNVEVATESVRDLTHILTFANRMSDTFTNSFGQGMANVVLQGERLVDTLKNIGRLLASSAIQTGISALLTGGLGGRGFFGSGGGLFGSLFGRTTSVNDALIRSNGSIVKFHPDDNILAMKDFGNIGASNGVNIQSAMEAALEKTLSKLGPDEIFALARVGEFRS